MLDQEIIVQCIGTDPNTGRQLFSTQRIELDLIQTVEVILFQERDSLVVYIDGDADIDLSDLIIHVQINATSHDDEDLSDITEFAGLLDAPLDLPLCLHMKNIESSVLTPNVCNPNENPGVDYHLNNRSLNQAEIFWFDLTVQQPRRLEIQTNNSSETCSTATSDCTLIITVEVIPLSALPNMTLSREGRYWYDNQVVTQADYNDYTRRGGYGFSGKTLQPPWWRDESWQWLQGGGRDLIPDEDNRLRINEGEDPRNFVSWYEADAYCTRHNKRLPTANELTQLYRQDSSNFERASDADDSFQVMYEWVALMNAGDTEVDVIGWSDGDDLVTASRFVTFTGYEDVTFRCVADNPEL